MWKLVRDKIPQIMKEKGHEPHFVRDVLEANLIFLLQNKLVEEAEEVAACLHGTDEFKAQLTDELADCYQVIDELLRLTKISKDDVRQAQMNKLAERGGFSGGILLKMGND